MDYFAQLVEDDESEESSSDDDQIIEDKDSNYSSKMSKAMKK